MRAKETRVTVESLRPVAVLYEGDIHELACLLLRLYEGKDRETNARNPKSVVRSQPTVSGLAAAYSRLVSDVGRERIEEILVRHGLPLGAVVEHDEATRSEAPTGLRRSRGTGSRRARPEPPGE